MEELIISYVFATFEGISTSLEGVEFRLCGRVRRQRGQGRDAALQAEVAEQILELQGECPALLHTREPCENGGRAVEPSSLWYRGMR